MKKILSILIVGTLFLGTQQTNMLASNIGEQTKENTFNENLENESLNIVEDTSENETTGVIDDETTNIIDDETTGVIDDKTTENEIDGDKRSLSQLQVTTNALIEIKSGLYTFYTKSDKTLVYATKKKENTSLIEQYFEYYPGTKYGDNHGTKIIRKAYLDASTGIVKYSEEYSSSKRTKIFSYPTNTKLNPINPLWIGRNATFYLNTDGKTLKEGHYFKTVSGKEVTIKLVTYKPSTIFETNHDNTKQWKKQFRFRNNGSLQAELSYNNSGQYFEISEFFDGTNFDTRSWADVYRFIPNMPIDQWGNSVIKIMYQYTKDGHKQSRIYYFDYALYDTAYLSKAKKEFRFRNNGSLQAELSFNNEGKLFEVSEYFDGTNFDTRSWADVYRWIHDMQIDQWGNSVVKLVEEYSKKNHEHLYTYHFHYALYESGYIEKAHTKVDHRKSWPVGGNGGSVSCGIGCYSDHIGVDIAANAWTPIRSILGGKVIGEGTNSSYGNYIIISSTYNNTSYTIIYAHMVARSSLNSGDYVSSGQTIGYVGNTGQSSGNHVHVETLKGISYFPWDKSQRRPRAVDFRYEFGIWG